jgi:hypothetical protein
LDVIFPLEYGLQCFKSWLKVSPFGILPFDSTHVGLNCHVLICASIPHLAMPWYRAILVVLSRPLVAFQNILKGH